MASRNRKLHTFTKAMAYRKLLGQLLGPTLSSYSQSNSKMQKECQQSEGTGQGAKWADVRARILNSFYYKLTGCSVIAFLQSVERGSVQRGGGVL